MTSADLWPPLPLNDWKPTYETLHLRTQIVGKIRLMLVPLINHWWNTTLYVTGRGLTTSTMPYDGRGLELRFDFVDHVLVVEPSWERPRTIAMRPQTTADFYAELMQTLHDIGADIEINTKSVEFPVEVQLDRDREHSSYDADAVNRWWRIMLSADAVFTDFRGRFIGKSSPSHFFWGSFDLAVTRFNGKRAPARPPGPLAKIMAEAYSHEVISAGFWPGGMGVEEPAFYAYAAPAPEGYAQAKVKPPTAWFDKTLGEFLLKYDDVRRSARPSETLMDFLETTYAAAADLAKWDRAALERKPSR